MRHTTVPTIREEISGSEQEKASKIVGGSVGENKGGKVNTMCFCNAHLTDIQIQDLRNGKSVICSVCNKLMWLENGKLQEREAHRVLKENVKEAK